MTQTSLHILTNIPGRALVLCAIEISHRDPCHPTTHDDQAAVDGVDGLVNEQDVRPSGMWGAILCVMAASERLTI